MAGAAGRDGNMEIETELSDIHIRENINMDIHIHIRIQMW
jgi:hypothetical protein